MSQTGTVNLRQKRQKPLHGSSSRARGALERAASAVAGAEGWRRRGIAFFAGALQVLAMAPFFFWPVLFITLPVLVWLIDGTRAAPEDLSGEGKSAKPAQRRGLRKAALDGWWFGFGYFFFGLFWIGEAFLVEAHIFGWLLPFAVTLMPAGLALFTAAITAAARSVWQPGLARVAVLAVCFGLGEWLRGHIFTGFPWNVLGYALTQPLALMQAAGVFGIYGLTLLAVLIAATPLVVLADPRIARPWTGITLLSALPLAAMFVYGGIVLSSGPNAVAEGVKLRIVQPSIPQHEKWVSSEQPRIFEEHLRLSRQDGAGMDDGLAGITHVFWPEAAMPFLPLSEPQALAAIGAMLPEGTHLVAGAMRLETAQPGGELRPSTLPSQRVFNSLIAFGPGGEPTAIYDKIHLVPFGEYLPAQNFLEAIGLESLTRIRGGFTPGPAPRPILEVPGLAPFAPLICYEAIFPAAVVQGEERPSLLVNVTNDGWFGNTTGPHQHLHQARIRAAEEGVAMLRVANNGVSAMIDPYGRVMGQLALNEKGTLDADLPLPRSPTLYARFGDMIFGLAVLVTAFSILLTRGRKRR